MKTGKTYRLGVTSGWRLPAGIALVLGLSWLLLSRLGLIDSTDWKPVIPVILLVVGFQEALRATLTIAVRLP